MDRRADKKMAEWKNRQQGLTLHHASCLVLALQAARLTCLDLHVCGVDQRPRVMHGAP